MLATGTDSLIDIPKNKIIKGIQIPPPPNPPALAKIVIIETIRTPKTNKRSNFIGVNN